MTFLYPKILFLLLLIPIMVLWYIYRGRKGHANLKIPSLSLIGGKRGWRTKLIHLPFILRTLALTMLITALARPQGSSSWSESDSEGIDIMLAMDVSGSMLAEDFKPNRLEASKQEATRFINNREYDNIGLVFFAGESFTASPLTTDHAQVLTKLHMLETGSIKDGTAIGLGLVTAINRLRSSQSKSKVVILLTDGINNAGDISPQTAADLAHTLGITVHCIGMGTSDAEAPIPIPSLFGSVRKQMMPVEIDEATLRAIASKTGGLYFRATDNLALSKIYKEIDSLEKTKLKSRSFHIVSEEYTIFALIAVITLLLEFILRHGPLRTHP